MKSRKNTEVRIQGERRKIWEHLGIMENRETEENNNNRVNKIFSESLVKLTNIGYCYFKIGNLDTVGS